MLGAFAAFYFAAAAYVLHFEISRLLFPAVILVGSSSAEETTRIIGQSGNELLVRRYGTARAGCVLFFPGQHGDSARYERTLFPGYVAEGLAVFALAYPGQDGAAGRTELDELQSLIAKAIGVANQTCAPGSTVFVGRSLGAMLAAYAADSTQPAGLVLESTAASLSLAIQMHLQSRWYLLPLAQLPVPVLLTHDYSLTEALSATSNLPITVFQAADEQTPIEFLRTTGTLPANTRLVAVTSGTHSDTHILALKPQIETILHMLRHEQL